MKVKSNPKISVCIPVYNSEIYLQMCLDSVIFQNFDSFEVVVVSDNSRGRDKYGHNAKKIVRMAEKKAKKIRKQKDLPQIDFLFVEHSRNLGTLETRRTLFENSRGDYIIQLDSDDQYAENALSTLYNYTDRFDIVHGSHLCGTFDDDGNFKENELEKNKNLLVWKGELFGHDVFHKYAYSDEISCILWSKLIKRDLYEKAFENITFSNIAFNGDFLLYYFISLYAESYKGLSDIVYLYRVDSGITSSKTIVSMDSWERKCAVSGVISIINDFVDKNPSLLSKKEKSIIPSYSYTFILDLLGDFYYKIAPELRQKAYEMLCDYWGEKNVKMADRHFRKTHRMR